MHVDNINALNYPAWQKHQAEELNAIKQQAIEIANHILAIKGAYLNAIESDACLGIQNATTACGTLDEFGVWDRAIVDECNTVEEAQRCLDGAKAALAIMFANFSKLSFA